MGGFGSAQSMITAMKNNRALLGNKKLLFRSKKDYISTKNKYDEISGEFFNYKTASPELLEEIRKKFIYKRKKRALINAILFLFIVFISFFLTYKLYLSEVNSIKPITTEIPKSIINQFNLIIKDADEWMEIGNFENAIIQYTRASKLIPNQYDVEYRICLSYSYLCRYDQLECEKGREIVMKTIEKFPNENKLKDLAIFFND
jgi:tetratricopeptide (TPR) repeat protein